MSCLQPFERASVKHSPQNTLLTYIKCGQRWYCACNLVVLIQMQKEQEVDCSVTVAWLLACVYVLYKIAVMMQGVSLMHRPCISFLEAHWRLKRLRCISLLTGQDRSNSHYVNSDLTWLVSYSASLPLVVAGCVPRHHTQGSSTGVCLRFPVAFCWSCHVSRFRANPGAPHPPSCGCVACHHSSLCKTSLTTLGTPSAI